MPFPCCRECSKNPSLKGCELKDRPAAPRGAGALPRCRKPSAQLFAFEKCFKVHRVFPGKWFRRSFLQF